MDDSAWMARVERTAERSEPRDPGRGDQVAWVRKDGAGKTSGVTSIHVATGEGDTFCKAVIPPTKQHLPPLASLDICRRCKAMSARALAYDAQAIRVAELRNQRGAA